MAKRQTATQNSPTSADDDGAAPAVPPQGALVAGSELPFEADAGGGMEGADADSFAIPFLSILQSNSPQVDAASPSAIEGARAGMLYENVGGRLFSGKPDAGVRVVMCAYRRVFLRWGPRSGEGSGFKGELRPEDVAAMRAAGQVVELDGRLIVPDENGEIRRGKDGSVLCDRLSDARNHYLLILEEDGSWQQALLSLTSTQIKKSKSIMAALASVKRRGASGMFTPPTFASIVRATTLPESNDKGNWFGIKLELEGFVDSADVYAAGKAFRDAVMKGQIAAKYEESATASEAPGRTTDF